MAFNLYLERIGHREVQQTLSPRRGFLGEVDVGLGAELGAPQAHTAIPQARVAAFQFFEQGDGFELGIGIQQRDSLAIPHRTQRAWPGAPVARWPLRREVLCVMNAWATSPKTPDLPSRPGNTSRTAPASRASCCTTLRCHTAATDRLISGRPVPGHRAPVRACAAARRAASGKNECCAACRAMVSRSAEFSRVCCSSSAASWLWLMQLINRLSVW